MASEYLKWKYRDVKPDVPRELTPAEKRANWWYYHKWQLAVAAVVVLALGNILWNVLGIGKVRPDIQVAYVGSVPLPEETAAALEEALADLGTDANGDGRVVVKLNQYVSGDGSADSNAAMYAYAASTTLMGDLESRDSYFFLLEDPEAFQRNYQILRRLDGTLPTDLDTDYENCYLPWPDCPALAGLDLGEYTETVLGQEVQGDSQELLSGLYVARRGFWTDRTCDWPEACDALWAEITKGAL